LTSNRTRGYPRGGAATRGNSVERYAFRMPQQITIRIPDALATALDTLVSSGRFESKADAVRTSLEALIDGERRAEVGRQIVAGYQRVPQEDADVTAASHAAARSIDEEPW
jgi:Arc/MetJ-type ribon-helix-helix transcriptional regulator